MLYEAEAGNLTLVASGDTMITRRLSVFREPDFLSLVDLFRSADVGYTNLEMLMHDFEHSPGMAGGTYTASDPANLKELTWAGINLVSTANNHAYDYGEGGVLTNLRHLKASGLAYAGTGANLSEAMAPGFLDTPAGRVALIAASSTFHEAGRAIDQRPDLRGRPGLNAVRHSVTYTVDRSSFDSMRHVSRRLGFEAHNAAQRRFRPPGTVTADSDSEIRFLGRRFVPGEGFGVSTKPYARDMEGNLKWIEDARRMADWVLVSFHCHESGETRDEPPEFLKTFAYACIDSGADVFLGHGPHVTRGIEIYKKKPIFYSLGNFVFQNDTVRWQPAPNYESVGLDPDATPADFYDRRSDDDTRGFPGDPIYWNSIVAKCEFRSKKLDRITLHAIDMGYRKPRSQRGRPVLAGGSVRRKALDRIKRLSKEFGVDVRIDDGVGVVRS